MVFMIIKVSDYGGSTVHIFLGRFFFRNRSTNNNNSIPEIIIFKIKINLEFLQ